MTDLCQSCRFWASHGRFGECRRHAPHPDGKVGVLPRRKFPITAADEWCGDYAERLAAPPDSR